MTLTYLAIALVALILFIALGTMIVQLTAVLAMGAKLHVGVALGAAILMLVVSFSANYLSEAMLGSSGYVPGFVAACLVGTYVIKTLFKLPGGSRIALGRAMFVSSVLVAFYVVLSVVSFFLAIALVSQSNAGR